ncbi:MAG: hypothetical protein GAK41_01628 [Burkholderia gladioli]|nr:MAG: hypothetical protein GAK41_01628 [Burkholderia gladioli]
MQDILLLIAASIGFAIVAIAAGVWFGGRQARRNPYSQQAFVRQAAPQQPRRARRADTSPASRIMPSAALAMANADAAARSSADGAMIAAASAGVRRARVPPMWPSARRRPRPGRPCATRTMPMRTPSSSNTAPPRPCATRAPLRYAGHTMGRRRPQLRRAVDRRTHRHACGARDRTRHAGGRRAPRDPAPGRPAPRPRARPATGGMTGGQCPPARRLPRASRRSS